MANNNSETFLTGGINPFFRTTKDIVEELKIDLIPKIDGEISAIFFYGAGIINSEKGEVVKLALQQLFPAAKIEVESDLLGAARATFQHNKGIACILGTGVNSCFYNGREINEHVPPLGFILGDEGSGAVLGRKLVADYLKGIMPKNIAAKFRGQFQINYAGFLEHVYKKERPNKFLAQFVPFLNENIKTEYCSFLVETSFNEFIERNIKLYNGFEEMEICFVGSVAFYFQKQLQRVMNKNRLKLSKIVKEPLQGLAQFHLKK